MAFSENRLLKSSLMKMRSMALAIVSNSISGKATMLVSRPETFKIVKEVDDEALKVLLADFQEGMCEGVLPNKL